MNANSTSGNFTLDTLRGVMAQMPKMPRIRTQKSSLAVERVQWRFPRTKKRRIRNKWAAREENVRYEPRIFLIGDVYYIHPAIYSRLEVQFDMEPFDAGGAGITAPKINPVSQLTDWAEETIRRSSWAWTMGLVVRSPAMFLPCS